MSLTSAISAARSGLQYSSRWAQTTSTNVANANNESYARRNVSIVTANLGEPRVSETWRAVDASMDRMYRTEVARSARHGAVAAGLEVYSSVLGNPGAPDGILTRLTSLQSSLSLLSISPSDPALQQTTVFDAQQLAASLNRANGAVGDIRLQAHAGIQADIETINGKLSQLAELNRRIGLEPEESDFRLSLLDQSRQVMDQLAPLMDFAVQTDQHGRVKLFTASGAPLLDGKDVYALSFDASSGSILAGDIDVTPGQVGVRGLNEGSLAGRLELFNDVVPRMESQLDEVAAAVIRGFEDADASLLPGDAGLFTDGGSPIGATFAPGLAGRIAVNAAVQPDLGGGFWRMRDGMGAAVPGAAGDSTQINAFVDMLDSATSFDPAAGLADTETIGGYVALMISAQQNRRAEAENARDGHSAGADTIQAARLGFSGVNIDDELQQLMLIEQAYGANSRVLTTVSEMIDTLLAAF